MSKKYFRNLNYTLANEDSALEASLVPQACQSIASVCGSGARVLPLLAAQPESVLVVDLSQSQLFLCELRIATASQLSFEEFLSFWGYPTAQPSATAHEENLLRKEIFGSLTLRAEVRSFFHDTFVSIGWKTLLYLGKWEATFVNISRFARIVLGRSIDELFDCATMNEHLIQLNRNFPKYRWELLVRLIGNGTFFNAMLYRGHFPEKNTPGSHSDYYRSAFLHLFAQGPARENFFLQLLLLGKLNYSVGNPIECQSEVFQKIKAGIKSCRIQYVQGNAVEIIGDQHNQTVPAFQFVSMSDVPSYFSSGQEERFVRELGKGIAAGGILVNRYYLHVAQLHDTAGFKNITDAFTDRIRAEKTQMYEIEVLQKEMP